MVLCFRLQTHLRLLYRERTKFLCERERQSGRNGRGGDVWFLNSVEESLGFVLADHDFDVWVGNVRGTHWSHGHISLSEKDKEFWDWSWQELACYDLVEMINYVHSVTDSKVFYVGHSQGTIMGLAAFTQPDIVDMVEAAALLSPISYLDHINSPFVLKLVSMHLDKIILDMGFHQLNFRSDFGVRILDSMCDGHMDCNDLLSSITGKNCCFNNSRVDFYLEYEPHPSSSKNLNHLFQSKLIKLSRILFVWRKRLSLELEGDNSGELEGDNSGTHGEAVVVRTVIRKGNFAKYDYGLLGNFKRYGQTKPSTFNLGNIPTSLPIWMAYGGNDALSDVTDLEHTIKELKHKPELLYLESYAHIDFILSVRAKEDVYNQMIGFFQSQGKLSSS
ncbi:hypothetical protein GIB67_023298 [Kingdonia uniflora]|uniref:Lipase n=1 Tax=Kingdonia uniflora TaxID=39325 RepID=A0A7J7P0A3_9MAGN|nr:hypothetical protein GIB67_023298 [Kingdonia uniflora]